MGLTKKTAKRWRGVSAETRALLQEHLDLALVLPGISDVAGLVLEEASRPPCVTRLEVLAATLLEEQATFWMRDDSTTALLRDAGLWWSGRKPTKAGAELLRRVREAAAAGRLPKPRRAG